MKTILGLMLFLLPCWVQAAPMVVKADHFELVQGEARAVFTGHVVATQDDFVIKANHMVLWYQKDEPTGKNKVKKVKATGQVWFKTAENEGSAQQVIFHADTDIVVLQGDARMQSEDGVVEGQHIEYNRITKDTTVLKGQAEKQVRFTFDE